VDFFDRIAAQPDILALLRNHPYRGIHVGRLVLRQSVKSERFPRPTASADFYLDRKCDQLNRVQQ
jgi:hypothetical protein